MHKRIYIMKNKIIPSWQKLVAGVLSVISLLLIVTASVLSNCSKKKDNEISLHSVKEHIDYLNVHSTIFDNNDIFKIQDTKWPTENITINTDAKRIFFVKDNDTIEVTYKKVPKKYACIALEDTSYTDKIEDILSSCTRLPIDSAYEKEISTNNKITEIDKQLSRLYNILVGNPKGHIILGKDKGDWKLYQTNDFPKYKLNEEKLRQFVRHHRNHPEQTFHDCYKIYPFIVTDTDLHTVYYVLRQDTVIERDNRKVSDTDPLQHDLTKLKHYAGWVNHRTTIQTETKWQLVSAYDYYVGNGSVFLDVPQDIEAFLKSTTWVQPNEPGKGLFVFLYIMSGACLLLGVLLFGFLGVRKFIARRKTSKPTLTTSPIDSPTPNVSDSSQRIKQLEQMIEQLQSDLEVAKKNAVEEYKRENDIDNKILFANHWTTLVGATSAKKVYQILAHIKKDYKSFPQLETAESVLAAQEQAVADFKQQYDIDNQLIRAKNWKTLVSCKTSKEVHSVLQSIKEKHASFPDLHTLDAACKKAIAAEPNNDSKQIAYLLQYIYQHVDAKSKWPKVYEAICGEAAYAQAIRPQHEEIKTLTQQLAESITPIIGKENLNYWDRLALSYKAIAELNQLLKIFEHPHIKIDTLNSAQSALVSDLLLQYLSRIFIGHLKENKSFSQYQTDATTIIQQKLADLNQIYAIPCDLDNAFEDARKAFEQAYSNIIGTKEFVQMMEEIYVHQFEEKVETNLDRGWFFSMIVAMGYHMVDFVHLYQGTPTTMCPNYRYLMSRFDSSTLPEDAKFAHNDYAYSNAYTNRIFEWLDELGVTQLKALVGRQLIKP